MRRTMTRKERCIRQRDKYRARTAHKRPKKMVNVGQDTLTPAGPPKEDVYQFILNGTLHTLLAPSALVARQILAERLGVHYKHFHPLKIEPVKDRKNPWGTVEEQIAAAKARTAARHALDTIVRQENPLAEKPAAKDVNFDFNSED